MSREQLSVGGEILSRLKTSWPELRVRVSGEKQEQLKKKDLLIS